MIRPTYAARVPPSGLRLDDFAPDAPFALPDSPAAQAGPIDGVTLTPLAIKADARGALSELLTTRDGLIEPIVHVYHVTAGPGAVRAWVYHRHQFDRLAFVTGRFDIALYDIRPGSPTENQFAVFTLGVEQPTLLRLPPLVVHGVCNLGSEPATFVNMPTRAYDPAVPDKCRLAKDDPRIPYRFNARG